MYSTLSKKQSSESFAPSKAYFLILAIVFGSITVFAGQFARAYPAISVTVTPSSVSGITRVSPGYEQEVIAVPFSLGSQVKYSAAVHSAHCA